MAKTFSAVSSLGLVFVALTAFAAGCAAPTDAEEVGAVTEDALCSGGTVSTRTTPIYRGWSAGAFWDEARGPLHCSAPKFVRPNGTNYEWQVMACPMVDYVGPDLYGGPDRRWSTQLFIDWYSTIAPYNTYKVTGSGVIATYRRTILSTCDGVEDGLITQTVKVDIGAPPPSTVWVVYDPRCDDCNR